MTPDSLRRAAREIAHRVGLDPAAVVMAGALAIARQSGRGNASPSAEERSELLVLAGHADDFQEFIDAATSRACQFILRAPVWATIQRRAAWFERSAVPVA